MLTVNYYDPDLIIAGFDVGGGEIYHYRGIPLTGVLQSTDPDGNLETEITCLNGFPEGAWREYFPNGQMAEESFIKYNLHYGPFRQWDINGNLTHQSDFGPEPLGGK